MPLCKECSTPCQRNVSRTAKNPGRAFWSCPGKCKVWNGWEDEVPDIVFTRERAPLSAPPLSPSSFSTAPPAVFGGGDKKTPTPTASSNSFSTAVRYEKSAPSALLENSIALLEPEKETEELQGPPRKKAPSSGKSGAKKRAAEGTRPIDSFFASSNNKKQKRQEKEKEKEQEKDRCIRCTKALDLEHELASHLRRYSASTPYPMIARDPTVRAEIRKEIQEAIAENQYICERCLGNEL
jgi:hypothetical protein